MTEQPIVQAIWFADDATEDDDGRIDLRGICDILDIREPNRAYTEGAVVFFSIRNIYGRADLFLEYIDLRDDSRLINRPLVVFAESPHEAVVRTIQCNSIPVPHDGKYLWRLRWQGETLAETIITAYIQPPSAGRS